MDGVRRLGLFAATLAVWFVVALLGGRLWIKRPDSVAAVEQLHQPRPVAPTPVRPHTVTLRERAVERGQVRIGLTKIVALRSDGTGVVRVDHQSPVSLVARRTIEFPDGVRIFIDDVLGRMARGTLPPGAPGRREPAASCLTDRTGTPSSRRAELLRHEAIGSRRTSVIRVGSSTRWFALDLSCALLRQEVERGGDLYVQEAVDILEGEPSASFFELGGLTEVTPREFIGLEPRQVLPQRLDRD